MKRFFYVLIVVFLFSCNQRHKFEITGTVENASNQTIYLEKVVLSESEVIDSAKVKKTGAFKLKGSTNHAGFYQLRVKNKLISLIVEPGEKIFIDADYNGLPLNYDVEGSNGSLLVQKLNAKMTDTRSKLDSLETIYKELAENDPSSALLDSVSSKYTQLIEEQRKHNITFMLNFYDNLASLYALYQKLDDQTYLFNKTRDIQFYKVLSDSLGKYHPESQQVKALHNNTKDLLGRLNNQRVMNLIENADAGIPDIKLPDTNQDSVQLSELQGNVVLLSFWASWHEGSITESVRLLDLYRKYHNKGFEIYQVSLDKSYEDWVKSIKFNELPWIHVSDLSYPNSRVASIYNVNELPTHYLINRRQDTIIGRNLTMTELDRKLSALLN